MEETLESLVQWGVDNQHLKGTPEFAEKQARYKQLRDSQTAPAAASAPSATSALSASLPSSGEDLWNRFKLAVGGPTTPPAGTPEPPSVDIKDIMAERRQTADPRSVSSRADRVLAGAIGGIPDLGIGIYNAGARISGNPDAQAAYVTPQMLANAGVPDLPADAPLYERLLESAGSAFLGGGANAASGVLNTARTAATTAGTALPAVPTALRMAAPTVVPTITGHAGGEAGGVVGKVLGDEETGRLLGSILGGASYVAPQLARSAVHSYYTGSGRPDAPEILAAANRQGVTPTAGMLGNDAILMREQTLSGQAGSRGIINEARTDARTQIGDAYDRAAVARGGGAIDARPTEGTLGERIRAAASESADTLRAASDQRQALLQERIGADTPVNVSPIFERGYGMMADPAANLTPSQRRGIDYRLTNELMPLVTRNAGGDPIPPAGIGHNGGPPLAGETAPYGFVRGFRTELGKAIDTPAGARMPPTAALYEPTTSAMRDAAATRGVRPLDFDTTQNMTRDIERTTPGTPGGPPGDVPILQRYIKDTPEQSYSYFNRGQQNPDIFGLLDATGNPALGRIFGEYMRMIGNDTINNPQGGARGPANFDATVSGMHPDSAATVFGNQAGNVADTAALARALNIPTQQAGLTRAVGSQGEGIGRMLVGQEMLGRLGNYLGGWPLELLGRVAGVAGVPLYRRAVANVLEGPTVRNALTGGPSPIRDPQIMRELVTSLTAQQQQHPTAP